MIPNIIHYCWFGEKEVPEAERHYISNWSILHPKWKIIKWNESNSPMSLPYMQQAFKAGKWANLSNLTRFYALKKIGGIYMDIDMNVLKAMDDLLTNECFLGFEEGANGQSEFWVNNAIIGAVPNHPFIEICYDQLLEKFDGNEDANLSAPRLVTEVLKNHYGLKEYGHQTIKDVTLYPREVFYPIHYNEAYKTRSFEDYVDETTIAVHMWDRSWLSNTQLLDILDSVQYRYNESERIANERLALLTRIEQETASRIKELQELRRNIIVLNEQLKNQASVSEKEIGIRDKELLELQISLAVLNERSDNWLAASEKELSGKNQEIQDLQASLAELSDRFDKQVAASESIINNRNTELHELQINLAVMNERLQGQEAASEKEIGKKNIELQELRLSLTVLSEQYESLLAVAEMEISSKNEEINELQLSLAALDKRFEKQVATSEERLNSKTKELQELQLNLDSLGEQYKNKVSSSEREISKKNAELQNLQQGFYALSEQFKSKVATSEKELSGKNQEIQSLQASLAELSDKFDKQIAASDAYKNIQEKNNDQLIQLLQEKVDSYNWQLDWYKATYEKRMLVGLIKDRVLKFRL